MFIIIKRELDDIKGADRNREKSGDIKDQQYKKDKHRTHNTTLKT